MVYYVYSLESPQWCDSNENPTYVHVLENQRDPYYAPPDIALWLTLINSNYPSLELIFMVLKVFEPLKFDCILLLHIIRLCQVITKSIDVQFWNMCPIA